MKPESLDDFLAWRPPHITELIGSGLLIPQGKIILFGPYKSWKSMTAIDLAFKLSSGKPWLGFKTTLSTVLIVQLEIPKAAYQKRVIKYCFGNKLSPLGNLFLVTTRNLKLDKAWGAALLKQWIAETQAQVVIIDPIFKIMSGRLTDEYDVRQFTDRVDEIIEELRVSFVLIHHEGKDWIIEGERYDRGADAAFGSAVFGWWCDSSIELRTISEGSNIVDISFPLLRLAEDSIKPIRVEINRSNLVFTNKGGEQ
ncbi:hypothetical protein LCGC14_0598890 [marine sediment metagenome]|uniref:SF4 helicase domain-containing protein n=1 Tax=marine sediment metagenome TaxID=412755 RepID=A0A0F9TXG9_9ZZZZ